MPTTQAERRAATRRALLDAAAAVLVASGHASTTTAEVAERAGVSHGTLFRYFPTKADLLVAVVEDLYPRLVEQYVTSLSSRVASGEGPLDVRDDLLAPLLAAMRRPDTRAGVELLTAARTDGELGARIAPMERAHRAAMREAGRPLLRRVAAGHVDDDQLDAVVDLVVDLTLGIAVSTAVADAGRVEAELVLAARLLRPLLAP